jgi:hypothetical protein
MNSTHTTGHLCVTGDGDTTSLRAFDTDELVASIEWDGEPEGKANENARRLVACWNACEGITTEQLEAGALAELIEAAKKAQAMMGIPERIAPRHRRELCDAIAGVTTA